ncbi:hypothetical protein ACTQ1O_01565 [Bilifractor sp. LCP21S3_A7]
MKNDEKERIIKIYYFRGSLKKGAPCAFHIVEIEYKEDMISTMAKAGLSG